MHCLNSSSQSVHPGELCISNVVSVICNARDVVYMKRVNEEILNIGAGHVFPSICNLYRNRETNHFKITQDEAKQYTRHKHNTDESLHVVEWSENIN